MFIEVKTKMSMAPLNQIKMSFQNDLCSSSQMSSFTSTKTQNATAKPSRETKLDGDINSEMKN